MNYRHAFHAGNFADVFKHAILTGLIEALKAKQTPFHYFDSHAGAGRYDLRGEAARKTREHEAGVQRLLDAVRLPTPLHIYLNLVRALNAGDKTREMAVYPGSPLIASLLMRESDHATLCELQADEVAALKKLFAGAARCMSGTFGLIVGRNLSSAVAVAFSVAVSRVIAMPTIADIDDSPRSLIHGVTEAATLSAGTRPRIASSAAV